MAAVVATSKEKKMDMWGRNIQCKHGFFSDFLLKIEEVRKYKSRIELEGRRIQSGATESPSDYKAKDLHFTSSSSLPCSRLSHWEIKKLN